MLKMCFLAATPLTSRASTESLILNSAARRLVHSPWRTTRLFEFPFAMGGLSLFVGRQLLALFRWSLLRAAGVIEKTIDFTDERGACVYH